MLGLVAAGDLDEARGYRAVARNSDPPLSSFVEIVHRVCHHRTPGAKLIGGDTTSDDVPDRGGGQRCQSRHDGRLDGVDAQKGRVELIGDSSGYRRLIKRLDLDHAIAAVRARI
jgi:hypothetical protein